MNCPGTPSTIKDALEWGRIELSQSGFDDPMLESRALLGGLLHISETHLHLNGQEQVPPSVCDFFRSAIARRKKHEPLAYILGTQNFFGADFKIDKRVLIPRPETELLVEEAIRILEAREEDHPKVLDVGTGSGCVAISLAQRFRDISVVATDVSEGALALAEENAQTHKVGGKIIFKKSHLYSQIASIFRGHFDMIVSNPPYISTDAMKTLDSDLFYEPKEALLGGDDGLDVIRPLVKDARMVLKAGGILLMEIGFDQLKPVSSLLREEGFSFLRAVKDYSGYDRLIMGELNGSI